MCLLEFECAKRLKAHSRAIPEMAPMHKELGYNSWPIEKVFFDGIQYTWISQDSFG